MAPRKRSSKKRGWPAFLYERDGYYSWRHPNTGVEYGLGRDKVTAFRQAMAANLHLQARPVLSLVDRIDGIGNTWTGWLDAYAVILGKRGLSYSTLRTYRGLIKRARALVPDGAAFDEVTTRVLAGAFTQLETEDKARTAQQFRSFLRHCFNDAIAEGWTKTNPVTVTRSISAGIKRARLTFDVFMRAYEAETTTWAKNAYALALVSCQARDSCAAAMFKDIREDAWWTTRKKTGAQICIPLALRLERFGMSLDDVVRQCRTTGVVSPYLIHQTQRYGNSRVGAQIWLATISRYFHAAVGMLGIDWEGKAPPTFHEIRSLGSRLYKDQGNVDVQALLGHKRAATTELYQDSRGAEWVKVRVK